MLHFYTALSTVWHIVMTHQGSPYCYYCYKFYCIIIATKLYIIYILSFSLKIFKAISLTIFFYYIYDKDWQGGHSTKFFFFVDYFTVSLVVTLHLRFTQWNGIVNDMNNFQEWPTKFFSWLGLHDHCPSVTC